MPSSTMSWEPSCSAGSRQCFRWAALTRTSSCIARRRIFVAVWACADGRPSLCLPLRSPMSTARLVTALTVRSWPHSVSHGLYWYYRKYHSRGYAEFARCTISACVAVDRAYRALTHQRQVYGPGTAIALPSRHRFGTWCPRAIHDWAPNVVMSISRIVRRRVGIRVRWSACAHTGCGYGPFAAYVQLHQRHGRHSTRHAAG